MSLTCSLVWRTNIPDWGAVVGLIGTGQEIHDGEESGLQQWVDAIVDGIVILLWDILLLLELLNNWKARHSIQSYSEPFLRRTKPLLTLLGDIADDADVRAQEEIINRNVRRLQ